MGRFIVATLLMLFIQLGAILNTSLACLDCPYPTPSFPRHSRHHQNPPPKHPPKAKPPVTGPKPPPVVEPPMPPVASPQPPPIVEPPKPPVVVPKPPPFAMPPTPPHVHSKPPPFAMPPMPPAVGPKAHPMAKPPLPPIVGPKPPRFTRPPPFVYPRPPPLSKRPLVVKPPVVKPPHRGNQPCPPAPPPASTPVGNETCPVDALKMGACVDVLSRLAYVGKRSAAKGACCPLLGGLADLDAALCLCTTIKAKLLNVNLMAPLALQLLVDCGKTPPPAYKCPT